MKISLNWLNEYVDVKEFLNKPDELARLLTGVGLEVEGVENPAKQFAHVVVGEIIERGTHPNADKLTLCQVNVGSGPNRQIVCGAKNHKQGDKVVVALPGAVLPGNFAIKISKIRDVESQGMLCSETELGLKDESEGILILPRDAKVGVAFAEYKGLNDIVYELNVTPNRADCLSHVGLAREISCLLEKKLTLPEAKIKVGTKKTKEHIDVSVKDDKQCPRYCGRSLFGVKVGPSPEWLKQRLTSIGVNTINNIVDVTNFVMMEYGQPLHAFDAKTLKGAKITVEKSKKDEKFTTFDGTEIKFTGEELTIRDGERAVALAGVIGGQNSGVTDSTTEIFLEAAHFNPKAVRRSARKHGIETDSAQRFSRGTDPVHVVDVMNRAMALIQEVAGGEMAKDHYDICAEEFVPQTIKVRKSILENRLGYEVNLTDFSNVMKRLHCKTKTVGETVHVEPPAFRFDLNIEMDFVEEYARIYGYDKIPETFPVLENRPTESANVFNYENRAAELLRREGFYEARNYNFVSPKWQSSLINDKIFSNLGLSGIATPVNIKNPLSDETSQMRQSLLPGLLSNLIRNFHYGTNVGRLFEFGFVFGKTNDGYAECHRLSAVIWGQEQGLWQKTSTPVVYELKATLERLIQNLNSQVQWRSVEAASTPSFVHPGQVTSLFYEGKLIGFMGALHPQFREEHKIRVDAAVFELDLAALMRGQPRLPKLKKMSKFPAVERDLALLVPVQMAAGDVAKEIEKAAGPILQSVDAFDVFTGAGVPEGFKSVAYKMVFQDLEATLSEEKLQQITQQILSSLAKKNIKTRS